MGHIFHNNSEVKICYAVSSSFYFFMGTCDVEAAKREVVTNTGRFGLYYPHPLISTGGCWETHVP